MRVDQKRWVEMDMLLHSESTQKNSLMMNITLKLITLVYGKQILNILGKIGKNKN